MGEGWTPLFHACAQGSIDLATWLELEVLGVMRVEFKAMRGSDFDGRFSCCVFGYVLEVQFCSQDSGITKGNQAWLTVLCSRQESQPA